MLKLLRPNVTPVGGYFFVDPDKGFKYDLKYSSFKELETHVQEYRSQNKLPQIENFREVWENWVCQEPGMPSHCCPVSEKIQRKFKHYLQAGKSLIKALSTKAEERFVDQELADSRAKTCVSCRANVHSIGHRHSGFYLEKYIRQFTGGRTTGFDDRLFTCNICTCLLKAKVHFRDDAVKAGLKDIEIARLRTEPVSISGKPLRCWQLDSVDNINQEKANASEEKDKSKSKKEK